MMLQEKSGKDIELFILVKQIWQKTGQSS